MQVLGRPGRIISQLLVAVTLLASQAQALAEGPPDRPKRFTVWDIQLNQPASTIPDEYENIACGTNGGPPSTPLPSFAAFKKCRPDQYGLHEVYFEYDDELEYVARALDDQHQLRIYAGTTVYEFPVVASVLIDDSGIVRGLRLVTDPRQRVFRDRQEFWQLANFLQQRFDHGPWTCTDLPPEDGEVAIGPNLMKSRCETTQDGFAMMLDQRFFQKKGQQFIDPVTGKPQAGAFESSTRFELYDAAVIQHGPLTK